LTTFSAVPVLPAIEIGKLQKTPDEVPFVETLAGDRGERRDGSSLGLVSAASQHAGRQETRHESGRAATHDFDGTTQSLAD